MKESLLNLSAIPGIYTETITMTFKPGVSSIFVPLNGPINKRIRFTAQHDVFFNIIHSLL